MLSIQHNDLENLLQSHQKAFPYLAGLISDYLTIDLDRANKKLSESMSMRIAEKTAKISTLTRQLKETTFKYYILKYEKEYLLSLYPKLQYVIDSETNKEMILYKSLYEDCIRYVREKSMFLSEVDHDKYPEVKQKYRFELQDIKSVKK